MREDTSEIRGGMPRALEHAGGGMSNYGRMPSYRNDGERSACRFRLRRSTSHYRPEVRVCKMSRSRSQGEENLLC